MSEVWDGCSSLSAWIEGHGSRVPLENILLMAAPSNEDYYQDWRIIKRIIVPGLVRGAVESFSDNIRP